MPFRCERAVRFGHVDSARIVYYPALLHILHEAFEELFDRHVGVSYAELTGDRGLGFPTVHAECEFRKPLRYGDLLQITTTVPEIGTKSVLFVDEVRVGDETEARVVGRFRRVAVNMQTLESKAIPDFI